MSDSLEQQLARARAQADNADESYRDAREEQDLALDRATSAEARASAAERELRAVRRERDDLDALRARLEQDLLAEGLRVAALANALRDLIAVYEARVLTAGAASWVIDPTAGREWCAAIAALAEVESEGGVRG